MKQKKTFIGICWNVMLAFYYLLVLITQAVYIRTRCKLTNTQYSSGDPKLGQRGVPEGFYRVKGEVRYTEHTQELKEY